MTPAVLKVVATPLGNVRDISLRAVDEIKEADAIFAEDTRQCLKLINALGIKLKANCRLISCSSFKEKSRIDAVVERLRAFERVLLMSDAGCPTISDPGSFLVKGVLLHGLNVEIIPGPSAHSAALMGAGIDTSRFAFLGFLPRKSLVRKKLIMSAAVAGLALIFYESPLRIQALLDELYLLLKERRVVVARELTKVFETFHRGILGEKLSPPMVEKGEMVVIVEAAEWKNVFSPEEVLTFIKKECARGRSAKDIIQKATCSFGLKKKVVYDMVMTELKSSARIDSTLEHT